MADPVMRERMGCNDLLIPSEDGGVEDDVTGRSLVDVGFERFGSLAADEVFALVPAYCLSGRMEASMLAVEPAVAHVAFLGQSTQPEMRPDMLATFGGEVADLLAAQGVVDPATGKPITTLTHHNAAVTGVTWHPDGDLIATADVSGLIRISHLDGTLERAFISVRPRIPGVESYASWTPTGLDVLEREAWRVLRIPEPEDGS